METQGGRGVVRGTQEGGLRASHSCFDATCVLLGTILQGIVGLLQRPLVFT